MDQPYANQDTQYNGMRSKNIDEKFCETCGAIIKIKAEICPTCGVRQRRGVDKTALLLFTFFLGGIGGHKFYTGKNLQGALYLLFCWTGIPSLIALVEFIAYAFTSSEKLEEKFEASGGGAIIAIVAAGISFISIAGILAAIAIPQFVTYRNRAYQTAVKSELQNLRIAEEAYFLENHNYSSKLADLGMTVTKPDVKIEIIRADHRCFVAIGTHTKSQKSISIDCNGFKQDSE